MWGQTCSLALGLQLCHVRQGKGTCVTWPPRRRTSDGGLAAIETGLAGALCKCVGAHTKSHGNAPRSDRNERVGRWRCAAGLPALGRPSALGDSPRMPSCMETPRNWLSLSGASPPEGPRHFGNLSSLLSPAPGRLAGNWEIPPDPVFSQSGPLPHAKVCSSWSEATTWAGLP